MTIIDFLAVNFWGVLFSLIGIIWLGICVGIVKAPTDNQRERPHFEVDPNPELSDVFVTDYTVYRVSTTDDGATVATCWIEIN